MSNVLVTHEKHGEYYYPASTDEELGASALHILTERDAEGYWYYDPDELDKETQEYRPSDLIETLLPEGHWPGWDTSEELRVATINNYSDLLKERYGDDQEVLDLKTKNLKAAIKEYKWRQEYRKWYTEMREVVDNQDLSMVTFKSGRTSPRAWEVLNQRSDHEYERVELEPLQRVRS